MIYSIFYVIFYIIAKLFFRLKVYGLENIPKKGAVLILANHISFLDPPAIGAAMTNRKIYYLARDTLFKNFFINFIFKGWHMIPMSRGVGFRGGLERALEILNKGEALLAFPEGTRSIDGKLQRGKPGIGMLVHSAKVPVIPCCIDGTFKIFPKGAKFVKFHRITVRFGSPLDFSEICKLNESKEVYQKIVNDVMESIKRIGEV
ncbi:MAG: lysophospholipid acyltransferase family protein [Candidatus Firestonebacteria bacterium]